MTSTETLGTRLRIGNRRALAEAITLQDYGFLYADAERTVSRGTRTIRPEVSEDD